LLDNCDYVAGNVGLMAFAHAIGSKNVDHGIRGVARRATRTDRILTLLRGQAERH
jgi:3-oxoacyl-[acyl-carrier protein] reductase